jgi:diketogulonate reductase-like aldo/keto reductase
VNPDRIRVNGEIFDFTVSDEDMERIAAMNQERFGPDPDNFDF